MGRVRPWQLMCAMRQSQKSDYIEPRSGACRKQVFSNFGRLAVKASTLAAAFRLVKARRLKHGDDKYLRRYRGQVRCLAVRKYSIANEGEVRRHGALRWIESSGLGEDTGGMNGHLG